MLRQKGTVLITAIIFVLLIAVRFSVLDNPPAEYHGWRQSDTEAMARNFIVGNGSIFYPQLNYDGAPPNYAQLEFQLTTFFIAILYRLFGYYYFLARLVPLVFFLGSAYYLYRLAKDLEGQEAGWLTLVVYGMFPFSVIFSRAIMPEAAALFFLIGGVYYFLVWQKNERRWTLLLLGAGFTALAISQKIPAIYIGVPMAYLVFHKDGLAALRKSSVWIFMFLSLVPNILYFIWLEGVAQTNYVTGIATNLLLPAWREGGIALEAWDFLSKALLRAYTPLGLLLALVGLFCQRNRQKRFIWAWAIAAILEIVFVAAVIQLDYYLLLIAPLVALLAGFALQRLFRLRVVRSLVVLFVVLITLQSYVSRDIYCAVNQKLLDCAQVVQNNTGETDLLVLGNYSPELLNLSCRYGWRANIFYPQKPEEEAALFQRGGATYFVVIDNQIEGDSDGSYLEYLENNYQKLELAQGVTLYQY